MKTLKIAMAAAFLFAGTAYANQPGAGSTPDGQAQAAKMMGKKAKAKKVKKVKTVKAEAKPSWTCPMHAEIHEAQKGQCPKCHMDLVQEEAKAPAMK
jgi:predicted pyridoxine 5'-phosphate oxidase superfamily flavin-nucleotide-binding protein